MVQNLTGLDESLSNKRDLQEAKYASLQASITGQRVAGEENANERLAGLQKEILANKLEDQAEQDIIRPIAGLIDTISGGKTNLKKDIQSKAAQEQDLTELSNQINKQMISNSKAEEKQEMGSIKYRNKLVRDFNKDKKANRAQERLSAATAADSLLSSNTPIGNEVLKRMILKLSGDSRFSDKDVTAFAGSPAVAVKLKQTYHRLKEGTFNPENLDDMKLIVKSLRKTALNDYQGAVNQYASLSEFGYGIPSGITRTYLQGAMDSTVNAIIGKAETWKPSSGSSNAPSQTIKTIKPMKTTKPANVAGKKRRVIRLEDM